MSTAVRTVAVGHPSPVVRKQSVVNLDDRLSVQVSSGWSFFTFCFDKNFTPSYGMVSVSSCEVLVLAVSVPVEKSVPRLTPYAQ